MHARHGSVPQVSDLLSSVGYSRPMDPTENDARTTRHGELPVRVVSVNDVVSLNLGYFRKAAGLTQQELADRIGWLKQVVSTAERSWEGRRSRNFTAGD